MLNPLPQPSVSSTGLALFICWPIIVHDGLIITGPDPGGGIVFRVTLPAALPEEEKQNA